MNAAIVHTKDKLAYNIDEAVGALGISRALLYRRIKDGDIKVRKDGSRTLITREELERYINALEEAEPGAA
jgi:excisionase family DNA binding protein